MGDKLQEIQKRHEQATPGPYMWDVSTCNKSAMLTTAHSGRYYVLGFRRWGMQGAMPVFQKFRKYEGPVTDRESLGMAPIQEFSKPRMAHHPDWDMWVDHPDAIAIEKSWGDVEYLLKLVEDLQEKLRKGGAKN